MSVAQSEPVQADRPKIVAIDDSKTVLAALRRELERAGFVVQTACDPSEISQEDARSARAVVVDVQMEHVFGDDVVSFLRDVWQVSMPIFLFSSLPLAELERRAAASGASGAVCKADGVELLLDKLKRSLEP